MTLLERLLPPPLPDGLVSIRDTAASCVRCPLALSAKSTVIYRGDPKPLVLFIGEAPGAEEDKTGLPFQGRSGEILDEKLAELPFPRYGITNAILHRPPGNKYDLSYGDACRPFLEQTVKALSPKVIVTLGQKAKNSVSKINMDVPTFHLVHPAAQFYDGTKKAEWDGGWTHLRLWLSAKGVHA